MKKNDLVYDYFKNFGDWGNQKYLESKASFENFEEDLAVNIFCGAFIGLIAGTVATSAVGLAVLKFSPGDYSVLQNLPILFLGSMAVGTAAFTSYSVGRCLVYNVKFKQHIKKYGKLKAPQGVILLSDCLKNNKKKNKKNLELIK